MSAWRRETDKDLAVVCATTPTLQHLKQPGGERGTEETERKRQGKEKRTREAERNARPTVCLFLIMSA